MRPVSVFGLVALSVCLVVSPPAQATAELFASHWNGTIYDVDPATGGTSNPRNTGTVHLVDVEYCLDGTLFGLTSWYGNLPNALYQVNPQTGAATLVGLTGDDWIYEGDLSEDPTTGWLYGVNRLAGGNVTLFQLNKATGAATHIGNLPGGDYSGLAFDNTGRLFALDTTNDRVLKLDKATGATLGSAWLSLDMGSGVCGLDVDPATGTMYAASGDVPNARLFTLSPDTGLLTAVGNTGISGLAGLTFVPEPGAGALLPLLLLVRRTRRRR